MSRFAFWAAGAALLTISACGPADNAGLDEETDGANGGTAAADFEGPLTVVFQRQKDPSAIEVQAEEVAAELEDRLGIEVDVVVPSSYGATVQALVSEQADVAYLSSLPYLLADAEVDMEILAAEMRDGRTDYDSVFVVREDSPYESVADLQGERMAFTSATSTSGYVFPYGYLVQQGFIEPQGDPEDFFSEVSYAGGYDQALLAVLNGQADLAAVSYYTMEGPTADAYLPAEDRAQLRILERNPGVPTHVIAARAALPQEIKDGLQRAILEIAGGEANLLEAVYGATEFVMVEGEEHVQATRDAVEDAGLDTGALVN
jgi:phosphonate transport system substrate-binding protein